MSVAFNIHFFNLELFETMKGSSIEWWSAHQLAVREVCSLNPALEGKNEVCKTLWLNNSETPLFKQLQNNRKNCFWANLNNTDILYVTDLNFGTSTEK